MGSTRISESNSISGGGVTGDSMTFTNTGIHERNAILYNFSYDQDLNSGDYVELKMPFFTGDCLHKRFIVDSHRTWYYGYIVL